MICTLTYALLLLTGLLRAQVALLQRLSLSPSHPQRSPQGLAFSSPRHRRWLFHHPLSVLMERSSLGFHIMVFNESNTIVFRSAANDSTSLLCHVSIIMLGDGSTGPFDVLVDNVAFSHRSDIKVQSCQLGALVILGDESDRWYVSNESVVTVKNTTTSSMQRAGYAWRRVRQSSFAAFLGPSFFGDSSNSSSGNLTTVAPSYASNASVLVLSFGIEISVTSAVQFIDCDAANGMWIQTAQFHILHQSTFVVHHSMIGRSSPLGITVDFTAQAMFEAARRSIISGGASLLMVPLFFLSNGSAFSVDSSVVDVAFDMRRWNFATGQYDVGPGLGIPPIGQIVGPPYQYANITMPDEKKFEAPLTIGGIVINFASVQLPTVTAQHSTTLTDRGGMVVTGDSFWSVRDSTVDVNVVSTSSTRFVTYPAAAASSVVLPRRICGVCLDAANATGIVVAVVLDSFWAVGGSNITAAHQCLEDVEPNITDTKNVTIVLRVRGYVTSAVAFDFTHSQSVWLVIANRSAWSVLNATVLRVMHFILHYSSADDASNISSSSSSAQGWLLSLQHASEATLTLSNMAAIVWTQSIVECTEREGVVNGTGMSPSTSTQAQPMCVGVMFRCTRSTNTTVNIVMDSLIAVSSSAVVNGSRLGASISFDLSNYSAISLDRSLVGSQGSAKIVSGLLVSLQFCTHCLLRVVNRSLLGATNGGGAVSSRFGGDVGISVLCSFAVYLTVDIVGNSAIGVGGGSVVSSGWALQMSFRSTRGLRLSIRDESFLGIQGGSSFIQGSSASIAYNLDHSQDAVVLVGDGSFIGASNNVKLPPTGSFSDGACVIFSATDSTHLNVTVQDSSNIGVTRGVQVFSVDFPALLFTFTNARHMSWVVANLSTVGVDHQSFVQSVYVVVLMFDARFCEHCSFVVAQGSTIGVAGGSNVTSHYSTDANIYVTFGGANNLSIRVIGRTATSPQATEVMRSVFGISNAVAGSTMQILNPYGSILDIDAGETKNLSMQVTGCLVSVNLTSPHTSSVTVLEECGGAVIGIAGPNTRLGAFARCFALFLIESTNASIVVDGRGCPYTTVGVEQGPSAEYEEAVAAQLKAASTSSSLWKPQNITGSTGQYLSSVVASNSVGLFLSIRGGARLGIATSQPVQLRALPNITSQTLLISWELSCGFGFLVQLQASINLTIHVDSACVGLCFGRLHLPNRTTSGGDNALSLIATRFLASHSRGAVLIPLHSMTNTEVSVGNNAIVGASGPVTLSASDGVCMEVYKCDSAFVVFSGGSLLGVTGGAEVLSIVPVRLLVQYSAHVLVRVEESVMGAAQQGIVTCTPNTAGANQNPQQACVHLAIDLSLDVAVVFSGPSAAMGSFGLGAVVTAAPDRSLSFSVMITSVYTNHSRIDINNGATVGVAGGGAMVHAGVTINFYIRPPLGRLLALATAGNTKVSNCTGVTCLYVRGRSRIGVSGSSESSKGGEASGNITSSVVAITFSLSGGGENYDAETNGSVFLCRIVFADEAVVGVADGGRVAIAAPPDQSNFNFVAVSLTLLADLPHQHPVWPLSKANETALWSVDISNLSFIGLQGAHVTAATPAASAANRIARLLMLRFINISNVQVILSNFSGIGVSSTSTFFEPSPANSTSTTPQPLVVLYRCVSLIFESVYHFDGRLIGGSTIGITNTSVSVLAPSAEGVALSIRFCVAFSVSLQSTSMVGVMASSSLSFLAGSTGMAVVISLQDSQDIDVQIGGASRVGVLNASHVNQGSCRLLFERSVSTRCSVVEGSLFGVDGSGGIVTSGEPAVYVVFSLCTDASFKLRGAGSVVGARGDGAALATSAVSLGALMFICDGSTNMDMSVTQAAMLGVVNGATGVSLDGSVVAISFIRQRNVTVTVHDNSVIGVSGGSTITGALGVAWLLTDSADVNGNSSRISFSGNSCVGICFGSSSQSINDAVLFSAMNSNRLSVSLSTHAYMGVVSDSNATGSVTLVFAGSHGLRFTVKYSSGCGVGPRSRARSFRMCFDDHDCGSATRPSVDPTVTVVHHSVLGAWGGGVEFTAKQSTASRDVLAYVTFANAIRPTLTIGNSSLVGAACPARYSNGYVIVTFANATEAVISLWSNAHLGIAHSFSDDDPLLICGGPSALATSSFPPTRVQLILNTSTSCRVRLGNQSSIGWVGPTSASGQVSILSIAVDVLLDDVVQLDAVIEDGSWVGLLVGGNVAVLGATYGSNTSSILACTGLYISVQGGIDVTILVWNHSSMGIIDTAALRRESSITATPFRIDSCGGALRVDAQRTVNTSFVVDISSQLGVYHKTLTAIYTSGSAAPSCLLLNFSSSVEAHLRLSANSSFGIGGGSDVATSSRCGVLVDASVSVGFSCVIANQSVLGVGDAGGRGSIGGLTSTTIVTVAPFSTTASNYEQQPYPLHQPTIRGFIVLYAFNASSYNPAIAVSGGSVIGVVSRTHYASSVVRVTTSGEGTTFPVMHVCWHPTLGPPAPSGASVNFFLVMTGGSVLGVVSSLAAPLVAENVSSIILFNFLPVNPISGHFVANDSITPTMGGGGGELFDVSPLFPFNFSRDSSVAVQHVRCRVALRGSVTPAGSNDSLMPPPSIVHITTDSFRNALQCHHDSGPHSTGACFLFANSAFDGADAETHAHFHRLALLSVSNAIGSVSMNTSTTVNSSATPCSVDLLLRIIASPSTVDDNILFVESRCNQIAGLVLQNAWYRSHTASAAVFLQSNNNVCQGRNASLIIVPPLSALSVQIDNSLCNATTTMTAHWTASRSRTEEMQSGTIYASRTADTLSRRTSSVSSTATPSDDSTASLVTSHLTASISVSNDIHAGALHDRRPVSTLVEVLRSANTPTSLLTSIALPVAGGLGIRRLVTLAALGQCSDGIRPSVEDVMDSGADDLIFLDSPMQLALGDAFGAAQRGTVVGNLLMFGVCIVAGLLLTLIVRCVSGPSTTTRRESTPPSLAASVIASAAALRLPGMYFVVVSLLLQPLVTASVLLMGYSTGSDVAVGLLGVCAVAALVVAMGRVLDPRRAHFRAVAQRKTTNEGDSDDDNIFVARQRQAAQRLRWGATAMKLIAAWHWFERAVFNWRARDPSRDGLFVQRYGFLFESCSDGRQWWLMVEVTATVVIGVLAGVVPGSEEACWGVAWGAVCTCVAALAASLLVRPMNCPMETSVVVLLWSAEVAMAICGVAGGAEDAAAVLGIVASVLSGLLAALMFISVLRSRVYRPRAHNPNTALAFGNSLRRGASKHQNMSAQRLHLPLAITAPTRSLPAANHHANGNSEQAVDAVLAEIVTLICSNHQRRTTDSESNMRDSNSKVPLGKMRVKFSSSSTKSGR